MPRMSDEVLARFLHAPHIGVLATLRRDGRPYTVPVWWLWKDGYFWITGTRPRIWCRQLMADPRCSLCIETTVPVARHAEVDGDAEVLLPESFDIWPISRLLAEKYVAQGNPAHAARVDAFVDNMRTEPRLLFRLRPLKWRAIDLTVYRGKKADREYQERHGSGGGR
jgi:PPOX class probable F420-dependent enzyme